MNAALIGYTGFVGSSLNRQIQFDQRYNTANISTIYGQKFDLLVISAAPAKKWWANLHPDEDKGTVKKLMDDLGRVSAKQVLLISTVDVYPNPQDVDENTPISLDACAPYGRHRLELETFVQDRFQTKILRLPGLFGAGLKKNIIFDFLNQNEIQKIDGRGQFQFYDLRLLGWDIGRFMASDLNLINLSTEPILAREVGALILGQDWDGPTLVKPAKYNVRSRHADHFGGAAGYIYSKHQILANLKRFAANYRRDHE